ncbi:MAG: hypothetical protein K1X88_30880 [Nannocystaceae bacterium]|nr:hypothetical protein [Nannocystaceae bacterium]
MSDVELRCRCGSIVGHVTELSPRTCNRAVCYCDDCQAFARWLGTDGVTDAHGGTDIVQLAPSAVTFSTGQQHLRAMRLSPKGLLRWYSDCCRVPMGNMVSARVPFVGLARERLLDVPAEALGPAIGVQGRFVRGGVPPGAVARAPLGMIVHAVRLLGGWWLRGKGRPSPYFDDAGAPKVAPQVLDEAERAPLYAG